MNSPSVTSTGTSSFSATSITVYYYREEPDSIPASGDAAPPAMWLILGLAAAGAIMLLGKRRRDI